MKVEKGQVRAPEIGPFWLNSPLLNFCQLHGRAVLFDFCNYTCVDPVTSAMQVSVSSEP
jgi:hypothetical protein